MPGIFRFRIGNISLLAYISESDASTIQVRNFNDLLESRTTIVLDRINEELPAPLHVDVSPYIMLNSEDLCCANIDLARVISNVTSFPHSAVYDGHVLSLCLELIKVYDQTQELIVLDSAEKLIQWIDSEHVGEDLLLINALQITRRKRDFTMGEEEILQQLKDTYIDDMFMLCGVSILLGDLTLFRSCFQMLSADEKDRISGFPIVNLLPQSLPSLITKSGGTQQSR